MILLCYENNNSEHEYGYRSAGEIFKSNKSQIKFSGHLHVSEFDF